MRVYLVLMLLASVVYVSSKPHKITRHIDPEMKNFVEGLEKKITNGTNPIDVEHHHQEEEVSEEVTHKPNKKRNHKNHHHSGNKKTKKSKEDNKEKSWLYCADDTDPVDVASVHSTRGVMCSNLYPEKTCCSQFDITMELQGDKVSKVYYLAIE